MPKLNTAVPAFPVADVDATIRWYETELGFSSFYEAVKGKIEIKMPLRKQEYGDWEFEAKDPNGYILVFSELIE